MQHSRLFWPSLSPWVSSNSSPLSQWCHLTISSSVTPFSCPRFFPGSGSFQLVSSMHQVAKVLKLSSVQPLSRVQLLWTHGLQHSRSPCPSSAPGVYPNSCPLSQWCHSTISSSVIPFSSCFQSFPASESFPMSQVFASGGQSIGVSASTSVLPMNAQDWSLGWTGWISLQSKGLKSLLQHHNSKASILQCSAVFIVHNYWKNHSLD